MKTDKIFNIFMERLQFNTVRAAFNLALAERDTEWKQKIQTALDKTSNWNCKEVLTKLLEEKL